MIDRKKEKLIHTMAFFIKKTKKCYKLKLFKLLYFLDFEHFQKTGKSVTGLEYFAWPMGPVPNSLYDELKKPKDLKKFFNLIPQSYFEPESNSEKIIRIIPKVNFDKSLFSKREMEIINKLVNLYKETQSKDMTEISHNRNGPWYRVFQKESNPQGSIPYEYILDNSSESISKEEAEEIDREEKEMKKMFG